ncbi:outer membrane beta-barrel protein [Pedobacter sp. P351]|uniref:outer membrane beta-barrel protein n=1 Tax=Pedobacter superstes TaxID=3133441 RepID=UPI003095A355
MYKLLLLITVLYFTVEINNAKAQQVNPNNIGSVKGLLQDTVHKYTVKSATVSIYRSDSTLLNYQLSNNYGEFSFKNLPINTKYYIEVSHVSYQLLRKSFALSGTQSAIDLKTIVLLPRDIALKEVEIRVQPIIMNGDTLEFNAAAFKLDSNAVVEDLLRKIPNVTLWGDGQITVNGREVKSLLVNGKEFFGGDFKMAIQNISKNALEKVQVYNTQTDEKNLLDSSLTVNLKLKKGKDTGHFGKVGGGYGTTERFEADGNINFFAPKLQLGFIAAGNNVNKIANNTRDLTANSTFKGSAISVEYQPDFRASGINRTSTGGATFSYNFIDKPDYDKRSTLTANYFLQNRQNDIISNSQTTTSIGSGSQIFDNTSSTNSSLNNNHNFDSRFDFAKKGHRINISQNFSLNSGESSNRSFRSASNQQNEITSTNNTAGQNDFNNKSFRLSSDYGYNDYINYKKKIRSFNARYNLSVNETDNERIDLTTFRSFVNVASNRDFNRKYNNDGSNINQQFFAEMPRLKRLFFGTKRLGNIDFNFSNDLNIINSTNSSQVADLNTSTGAYTANAYLSNSLRTNTLSETPALTFMKNFSKSLSNRFNRSLNFNVSAKHKFSYQNNRADKSFRNISRSYSNFIPAATVSYYKTQYGEYSNNISLNFLSDVRIPTVDQLAPLIDSANVYRIQRGNINLRESKTNDIRLYFSHTDLHGKNTLNYTINASLNFTGDAFTDSIFIDNLNRRTIYSTNADGYKSASLGGDIKKALKFKTSALQSNIGGTVSFVKSPGYVNNAFSFSNNLNTNTYLSFNYTYKDKLSVETKENLSFYRSRQNAFNTNYSGTNISSVMSGSYNINKKFSINSNISLNSSTSSASRSINYNIWNAGAVYRFLKGNNAELKFTALDLLRQNNSIINTGNANSFTFATRNVLQQYFMTTFSYYPRQFGKTAFKK